MACGGNVSASGASAAWHSMASVAQQQQQKISAYRQRISIIGMKAYGMAAAYDIA